MHRYVLALFVTLLGLVPRGAAPQSPPVLLPARTPSPTLAAIPASEFRTRRDSLAGRLRVDGMVIAFGSPAPSAEYYPFTQDFQFRYLTGSKEPGARFILAKRGGQVKSFLFVRPPDAMREAWEGPGVDVAKVTRESGMTVLTLPQFDRVVDSLLALPLPVSFANRDEAAIARLAMRHPELRPGTVEDVVLSLRSAKSQNELDLLEKAIIITVEAEKNAMLAAQPGMNEFELQATIEYTFSRYGSERPGFTSLVQSGANGTILHYNANNRFTQAGDLVVMDVGACYDGYTADVTRTIPVSGKYTPEQTSIYQTVRAAQTAAERAAVPRAPPRNMDIAANLALAEGLTKLGLMTAATGRYYATVRDTVGTSQLSLYYFHGLGHGIGLDVHDPGRTLLPGDAFTIEPGIYVRENLMDLIPDIPANRAFRGKILPVFPRYKGIGIRIEDDYMMTERGLEWASPAPREIPEIEALMAQPGAGPLPRNPAIIDWYRAPRN